MSHTLNTTKIVTQSTATTIIHTLSLHDALPISGRLHRPHVQLRHGREIHHHLPRIPGHPSRERLVGDHRHRDRKSTRLNSSHVEISYAVFCLKKKLLATSNYRTAPTKKATKAVA